MCHFQYHPIADGCNNYIWYYYIQIHCILYRKKESWGLDLPDTNVANYKKVQWCACAGKVTTKNTIFSTKLCEV
jgi:hypothetical protein